MPKLIACPFCGFSRSWLVRRHHRKCKRCRREWSPGTRFLVSGLHISHERWERIVRTFLVSGTIAAVASNGHRSFTTAQLAVLRIRSAMTDDVPPFLSGTCEVDETYVGGAWKNKAIHIRRQGTKRGRGTQKQAIFGIVSRELRQVRTWLVLNTQRETLFPIIAEHVASGSTIYTDGASVYRTLPSLGYHHDWVDHDASEYARGDVHTQTIDGFWGYLKNRLAKIGGIQRERAHLFVGEQQWRYNFRALTLDERVARIVAHLRRFGGKF